jgi:dolichol-phosphate mannosyltransferase
VEVTYRSLRGGATVREVPIRFRDRKAGTSKMSSRIVVEALWRVAALRLRGVRLDAPAPAPAPAPAARLRVA